MSLPDRFLRYVAIDTQACPHAGVTPSSPGQMELAHLLTSELHTLGLPDAAVDAHGYVTASLAARNAPHAPAIGFIAHLDTACEASGANVRPRIIHDYDGGDLTLQNGLVSGPALFPDMAADRGKTLIVTDGTTLLGADDKAGIAIIMTMLEHLQNNPEIPHGPVRIAFVPDEEIGHGASLLDLDAFGADFAYTFDGSGTGTLEYENFNAAGAEVRFAGLAIHPGYAKNRMVNAIMLAQEFMDALPKDEMPASTEDRQGFYHVFAISGNVGEARIELIIRDHDGERFEMRKLFLTDVARHMNERWPNGPERVRITIQDQYRNMIEKIRPHAHIVETALQAMRDCGITPQIRAIRGGTDGSQLSWRGLPTPNLFCGARNAHGPCEYVAVEDMHLAVATGLAILARYARQPG